MQPPATLLPPAPPPAPTKSTQHTDARALHPCWDITKEEEEVILLLQEEDDTRQGTRKTVVADDSVCSEGDNP